MLPLGPYHWYLGGMSSLVDARTRRRECLAATKLIADCTLDFDGRSFKHLKFFLPPMARQHYNHHMPVWRSGSCTVRVERHNWYGERTHRSPPQRAASASYFKIWPAVRETAEHITKECISDSIESKCGLQHYQHRSRWSECRIRRYCRGGYV